MNVEAASKSQTKYGRVYGKIVLNKNTNERYLVRGKKDKNYTEV